jgi:arylsulfatase A-like enzyme
MYEEAVQVPMMWSWLGRVPAENTRPEMISFYDFLPSLCEAVGLDAPNRNLCGRSYWPIATNRAMPKNQPWRNLVFAELRNTGMARDSRYKVVVRDGGKGPGELYDLRTDPQEHVNQYGNPQFVNLRDRLAADLRNWQAKYAG